jgi:hypothetical protein
MKYSEDTKQVLDFLDYMTGDNLRKRNDLGAVLEIGAAIGKAALVDDIIFTGKSLWTLSQKIRRTAKDEEGAELLQQELAKQIDEIKEMLGNIAAMSNSEEIAGRFAETYMPQSRGAALNLFDLAHDLAELKNLQIQSRSMQRKKDQQ